MALYIAVRLERRYDNGYIAFWESKQNDGTNAKMTSHLGCLSVSTFAAVDCTNCPGGGGRRNPFTVLQHQHQRPIRIKKLQHKSQQTAPFCQNFKAVQFPKQHKRVNGMHLKHCIFMHKRSRDLRQKYKTSK